MHLKIKVVEKWDKYLITPFNFLKGEYPTIIEKGRENCWLRAPTDNEYLHYDWEEPTENIEVVSTFQGWLDYLKMPKCFYCGEVTSEEYVCEGGCGELYCDNCSAKVTLYNNPERNCCLTCQENSKHE